MKPLVIPARESLPRRIKPGPESRGFFFCRAVLWAAFAFPGFRITAAARLSGMTAS